MHQTIAMNTVAKNKVVRIHYTLKDESGEVLDRSEENDPLAYIQGTGNLVRGLEESLEGKTAGSRLDTIVPPEKGYGLRSEDKVHVVPASSFQAEGNQQLVEGLQVKVETEEGIVLADVAKIARSNKLTSAV